MTGPVQARYTEPQVFDCWQITAENGQQVAEWCGGTTTGRT